MVLDRTRRSFDFLVLPLARAFRSVNPNAITFLGLTFAVLASALIWKSDPATEPGNFYLVAAAILTFFHGLFDMLDGVVARTYQVETRLGDFLDHVADRVGDILLLSAVAFSPWGDPRVGLFAVATSLLTSYLGTQAQAVGAGRMYTGFVARADRLVLLMVGAVFDHAFTYEGIHLPFIPGAHHLLNVALWYIAVGGAVTALERFVRIIRFLRRTA